MCMLYDVNKQNNIHSHTKHRSLSKGLRKEEQISVNEGNIYVQ